MHNLLQSALLLGGMGGLLAALGWLMAEGEGVIWTLLLGLAVLVFSPRLSPAMVLRLYGAHPLDPYAAPRLYDLVEVLARRAELPAPPRLYYLPSRMLNAFAVGRPEAAAITLSDGLLRTLTSRELTGVLAHEMSHLKNNDMWVMGLADVVSRLTSVLSLAGQVLLLINLPLWLLTDASFPWLLVLLLMVAPTVSALLQLALSRIREYDADLHAAALTGDPHGLASALDKLERIQGGWLERVLMPGRRVPDPSLLRTHPPTEERIQRLLSLSPQPQWHGRLPLYRVVDDPWSGRWAPVRRPPSRHVGGLWY
jgi:heat shock protein HtpX